MISKEVVEKISPGTPVCVLYRTDLTTIGFLSKCYDNSFSLVRYIKGDGDCVQFMDSTSIAYNEVNNIWTMRLNTFTEV